MEQGAPFLEARHSRVRASSRKLASSSFARLEASAERDPESSSRGIVRALGRAGLLRHVTTRAYGGTGADVEVRSLVAAREGIAYGSGLADALFALQGLGSLPITISGTDEHRKTWLPGVVRGQAIAAFAMTEPEAGSDLASMTSRARKTRNGWELSGTKTFISNAGIADYYCLFAKTNPNAGSKSVSAFLIPKKARGLRVEPLKLLAPHPLGTVRLKKVRLPAKALIGAEGEGLKIAYRTLDMMRPTVAAAACGLAERALDEAVKRAQLRSQFGHAIGENQGLRWQLADAATELEASRLLVYRAAWLKDQGQERITVEAAQAKLFATEAAQRIIDLCVQVHGGTGVLAGSVPERLYREIRALRIYEGTSEILRDVIARGVMA